MEFECALSQRCHGCFVDIDSRVKQYSSSSSSSVSTTLTFVLSRHGCEVVHLFATQTSFSECWTFVTMFFVFVSTKLACHEFPGFGFLSMISIWHAILVILKTWAFPSPVLGDISGCLSQDEFYPGPAQAFCFDLWTVQQHGMFVDTFPNLSRTL